MGKHIIPGLILLAILFMVSACNGTLEQKAVMLGDPPTPEQVIRGFYNEYLEHATNGILAEYYEKEIFAEYDYLSRDFILYMRDLSAQSSTWSYDPILCSSSIPNSFKIIDDDLSGDDIILTIQTNLENHQLEMVLTPQDEHYLIKEIKCK